MLNSQKFYRKNISKETFQSQVLLAFTIKTIFIKIQNNIASVPIQINQLVLDWASASNVILQYIIRFYKMSVKLPLIIKKQPTSGFHSKPAHEQIIQKQQNAIPQQQQGEPMNDQFQQLDQIQEDTIQKPPQTIIALKNQSRANDLQQQKSQPKKEHSEFKESRTKLNLEQLIKMSEQKQRAIENIREIVSNQKKQIKQIGDQIDRDLNKSIIKASKQHTINIRDIFSSKLTNTENKRVNQLNEQLKKVRLNAKKIKSQINKLQDILSDPVNMMNQERGIDCERKMKEAQSGIKEIQHEKTLLSEEINRGGQEFNHEEDKERTEKYNLLNSQLLQIQNAQKQEKLEMYHIEKQDILLMEKIKYFQQKQGSIWTKKIKTSEKDRQKLQEQIKELIIQINEHVQERNKVQKEKKQKSKNLANQKSSFQSKNWELCNKIREIDAFLLQYYQRRTKKKDLKQMETIDVMEKSVSGKIEVQSVVSQSLFKSKFSENDKNLSNETVSVQKRKIYEFGTKQLIQNQITLSDQFLGVKINLQKLSITADAQKIYNISATYANLLDAKMNGFVMGSKQASESASVFSLQLLKDEVINLIHVGYCQKSYVSFMHFITSEGKQLKWGKLQNLAKSEQKHIKRYQTSFIKAKFTQQINNQSVFRTHLIHLSFVTTFLSPK